MEPKHYVFLLAALALLSIGTIVAKSVPTVRDWCAGVSIFATTQPGAVDVNFMSREFYRAPTRGFELSVIDVLAGIIILSTPSRRRGFPASLSLMVAYTACAALTIPFNDPMLFGLFELSKLLRGLIVFTAAARYVRGQREVKIVIVSLCVAMGYVGLVAIQHRYLYHYHRIHATLGHPNDLSMYANTIGPIMLTAALANHSRSLKRACGVVFALCGLSVILTISRTGFAVFVLISLLTAVACVSVTITPKKVVSAVVAIGLAGGAIYRAKDTLASRYGEATLEQEATTGRGTYFQIARLVVADHPFGIGLNNWSYIVTNHYYRRLGYPYRPYTGTDVDFSTYTRTESEQMVAPPAHNLMLLTLGEVGIPGFILFCGVWYRWFRLGAQFVRRRLTDPTSRYGAGVFFALLGLFLTCLTEYGFRHSSSYFLTHILVGALAGVDAGRKRNHLAHGAAGRPTRPLPPRSSASLQDHAANWRQVFAGVMPPVDSGPSHPPHQARSP